MTLAIMMEAVAMMMLKQNDDNNIWCGVQVYCIILIKIINENNIYSHSAASIILDN